MDEVDTIRLVKVSLSFERAKEALAEWQPTGFLFPPERKLFTHQIQAVNAAKEMGFKCLIADEMGLGKTTTALTCFQQSRSTRLIVVCPSSVKHNWKREVYKVLGETTPVHLVDGRTRAKKLQVIGDAWVDMPEEGGVLIINYDMLPHIGDRALERLAFLANRQFVVLDESHYIKSRDAQRTKLVMEHLRDADYRLCLTGTPVRNMIDDLYCQAEFCRPGFWTSYHDFCSRYLIQVRIKMGNRTFYQTKGTKNTAELNTLVNTFQIRRSKEETLDLPPKIRTTVDLELDDSTKRIYKALRELAIIDLASLDDETPMFQPKAASAVEAALRCEQIAQGFIGGLPEAYVEKVMPLIVGHAESIPGRTGELIFPKSEKVRWVREKIDDVLEQGGAPVVFSKFNGPLFWLVEQYEGFGFLHGKLTSKARDDIIQKFQSGELRGLFCQVKIAEGFDLYRSQDVIFYGRDWSPAINAQAEDRCHRIGTTGTVNIQIPVMQGTIEAHINKRLSDKADDAENVIKNMTVGELREIL